MDGIMRKQSNGRRITRRESLRQHVKDRIDREVRRAVAVGNVDSVQKYLDLGISPNETDCNGWTLLHLASSRGRERVLRILLQQGGRLDVRDYIGGFTCLHYAAMHGRTRLARLLLEYDTKCELVNIPSNDGWMAMHVAAHYGRESFIRLLLQYQGNIDPLSTKNTTPLQLAIIREKVSCVKLLLDHQADIDVQMGFPLRYAVIKGNNPLCKLLLIRGASANLGRKDDGQAPLHLAALKNDLESCRLLCTFGANVYGVNDEGKTALETYQELIPEKGVCQEYLTEMSKHPRSLQDTCRHVIRQAMGRSRLQHIDRLPFSTVMKNYISHKYS
ncbi:ankyrin repeat and SOCS box protein 7-like [Amphiura filiformis]|uniref:ankyrin repeat and SOCS box protein 7-like n=1 Tax=Amphiura filiformis TaxID=82378 RepID=UPI003B20CB13